MSTVKVLTTSDPGNEPWSGGEDNGYDVRPRDEDHVIQRIDQLQAEITAILLEHTRALVSITTTLLNQERRADDA